MKSSSFDKHACVSNCCLDTQGEDLVNVLCNIPLRWVGSPSLSRTTHIEKNR